jgi:hypothetical protein
MSTKRTRSNALVYKRLRRDAGRELGCAATDEAAVTLANYRFVRATLQHRLVAGAVINVNELLALDAAIKAILVEGRKTRPTTVTIQLVSPDGTPAGEIMDGKRVPDATAPADAKAAADQRHDARVESAARLQPVRVMAV